MLLTSCLPECHAGLLCYVAVNSLDLEIGYLLLHLTHGSSSRIRILVAFLLYDCKN